jgi:hypothetical protein
VSKQAKICESGGGCYWSDICEACRENYVRQAVAADPRLQEALLIAEAVGRLPEGYSVSVVYVDHRLKAKRGRMWLVECWNDRSGWEPWNEGVLEAPTLLALCRTILGDPATFPAKEETR